ncbi:ciliated left-right organizer protein containing ZP-N domains homolog [Denticeps clupeoides]|uniref:ciliated left-right organizer protein containing ZP-N domains homolog n=1 Tax=Denticeps clupeoides TaxID=299321 RepID=UPI0010A36F71|nr:uncharacterized protein C1orf127 homolog [Denticeps clupeoides]
MQTKLKGLAFIKPSLIVHTDPCNMEPQLSRPSLIFLCFVVPVLGLPRGIQDWMSGPSDSITEGEVECFSEYMELWIHRMRIEGLRLWLSGILRIQVSLSSLDHLNTQLSVCGFALRNDPDKNYIFRVTYSGCFVQLENGNYIMVLNLLRRINRFGGRTHSYVMRCPTVAALPNREHVQCDPDFVQVTRQVPVDSWNNQLHWSLALRGSLVVDLEDASLIQVNVELKQQTITVQGRRNEILTYVSIMESRAEFLPLKLVSGQYAYSMEATCPQASSVSLERTVLYIFKRRMGLTKRGGYDNETLSVRSVSVNQTDNFTWSENLDFVQLVIPTSLIQQEKKCMDESHLQPFFRVDVVLSFKETIHKMHWTLENTLPCRNATISSVLTATKSDVIPTLLTTNMPTDHTVDDQITSTTESLHPNIYWTNRSSVTTRFPVPFPGTIKPGPHSVSRQEEQDTTRNSTDVEHSPEPVLPNAQPSENPRSVAYHMTVQTQLTAGSA